MEKITQKKFHILTDSDLDQDSRNRSLNHLVKNNHIPHLVCVDYTGDVDIEAPSYEVNKNKGEIQVRYDALPVKLKDSEFVASFIHDRFGQYAQFFKEWLALYVYTNYRKLPTIILVGPRGRGKSTIAEMTAEIYPSLSQGWHGHEETHNYEVEKKFLYVEENEMSNSHQYKTLKKYSGQKYAMVNKKFKDPYRVKNNTSIMMLTNDKVPIYVKRDELPTDSKNNQFFVYELPPIKTGINTDIQSDLVNRLGHYIRTELKQVYEGLNMDGYRYSIDVPITPEEKLLFQCSTTDLEADADKFIEKMVLSKNEVYSTFFEKGYVPVQFFKDFDVSANHYNRVIKNLVKRGLLMGNPERIMVKNERHYCYKMTDLLKDEIDKATFKKL